MSTHTRIFPRRMYRVGSLLGTAVVAALATVAVSLFGPASAAAAVESGALSQLPEPFACVGEEKEAVANCGTRVSSGLSFAYQIQISPDGKYAYSVAVNGDLTEYLRNPASGALTLIGCISSLSQSEQACAEHAEMEVSSMEAPAAIAISPDGASVYVVTQGSSNDVVEFRRNPEGGLLTKIGCISGSKSTECGTIEAKGLQTPYGVTVSPEGENVYVAGFASEAVAEFKRNTGTGVLTQLEAPNNCISDNPGSGCGTTTGVVGLKEAIGVVASPDGKDVYAAAGATGEKGDVAAFERGPEGALVQLSNEEACIGEGVAGCATGAHLEGSEDLVVSPDGTNVYANSAHTNAVVELKRTASGALEELASPNECVSTEVLEHCTRAKGIGAAVGVAISPGGEDLYASSAGENSVAAFKRGAGGALEQLAGNPCVTEEPTGCEAPGSGGLVGLKWARRLTVSPDGTNVYVAGQDDHAIAELTRTVTPDVTKIEPNAGTLGGGTTVEIEGSGFAEGAKVNFGGVEAEGVTVNSATSITAISPPGAQAEVGVSVTNNAGTSAAAPADEFQYQTGGLGLSGYCQAIGDEGNAGNPVVLVKETVEGPEFAYNNWACVTDAGSVVLIANSGPAPSMANACALAYPKTITYAYPEEENNAYSWGCHLAASPSKERERERTKEPEHTGSLSKATIASSGPTPNTTILGVSSVPAPALAVTGNVAPISGTVLVRLPGTSTFVPLASLRQIPFGTVIEATHGHVGVTTAQPNGTTQTGEFFEGEFVLKQGRNGVVIAELTGGNFSVCPTARERAHKASASAAASHASGKHVVRKLWANAHGSFSTKGNYAAGAVQGTEWLTEDLCEGTIIRVTRDKVAVTNLVNHHHVEVTTGHKYLAKAP